MKVQQNKKILKYIFKTLFNFYYGIAVLCGPLFRQQICICKQTWSMWRKLTLDTCKLWHGQQVEYDLLCSWLFPRTLVTYNKQLLCVLFMCMPWIRLDHRSTGLYPGRQEMHEHVYVHVYGVYSRNSDSSHQKLDQRLTSIFSSTAL